MITQKLHSAMHKAFVAVLMVALTSIAPPLHADPSEKQLTDAYEDIGEAVLLKGIKEKLGADASVWWILARIINSIPGDSTRPAIPNFDPAYASLTMKQLQERLGRYIVARNAVSQMPSTPGTMESLKVLDGEIEKMRAESTKRAKSGL